MQARMPQRSRLGVSNRPGTCATSQFEIFLMGRNWIAIMIVALAAVKLAAAADQGIRLAGFQALLFNSKTGAFSADVLAKEGPELGNVPSGEMASLSTFILVKVQIAKNAPIPANARVRLLATESGSTPFAAQRTKQRDRIILDQTEKLGPISSEGITYVGFWLPNTGCRSISLKASLVGVEAPPITEVLPFACYE